MNSELKELKDERKRLKKSIDTTYQKGGEAKTIMDIRREVELIDMKVFNLINRFHWYEFESLSALGEFMEYVKENEIFLSMSPDVTALFVEKGFEVKRYDTESIEDLVKRNLPESVAELYSEWSWRRLSR
ncbi:MAG: hypothetical protein FWG98_09595 [Candidatus Cloacimonetes bacterium]|nr:hypothetical protein [Candidatus Cloacimonadota bacterium]